MQTHIEALQEIVNIAPSGFPSFNDMRECLRLLHLKESILGSVAEDEMLKTLNDASNNWRIMAKDTYTLARDAFLAKTPFKDATPYPDVNELLAKVELPTDIKTGKWRPMDAGENGAAATEGQPKHKNNNDVIRSMRIAVTQFDKHDNDLIRSIRSCRSVQQSK